MEKFLGIVHFKDFSAERMFRFKISLCELEVAELTEDRVLMLA
jgi:hypothetical protein